VPEPYPAESRNGDNLALAIKKDVLGGTLPQVSWVVTDQLYSEHPDGAPRDGAYYINEVLRALNADPDVFNSTLVIIDFDENDGQFDHIPPPVPAPDTTDEFYLETSLAPAPLAVGLGFRVPLLLISPWTRGGRVTSEVSDHTSVIQFLEKWTEAIGSPAICPNISAWRRSVCGDLTAALGSGGSVQANLSFSNAGSNVRKASHFSVYSPTRAPNRSRSRSRRTTTRPIGRAVSACLLMTARCTSPTRSLTRMDGTT
jgi:phospholipase C